MSEASRKAAPLPASSSEGVSGDSERQHSEAFMAAKLRWPLPLSDAVSSCGEDMAHVCQRIREASYYCHKRWPMPSKESKVKAQFIDANAPFERFLRSDSGPRSDDKVPALLSSTQVVMRRRDANDHVEVRMLRGQEVLALQGWAAGDYTGAPCETVVANKTLVSLAGNAFSQFAAGAVCFAVMPMVVEH
eukprot:9495847-Pyramimonas_sp.AAC.1